MQDFFNSEKNALKNPYIKGFAEMALSFF